MTLNRRDALGGLLAATALPVPSWAQPAGAMAPADAATRALHELFDRYWDQTAQRFPEWATFRGDHRFGDRLSDPSPEAQAEDAAQLRRWLTEVRAIPGEPLSATDRVSRAMFIHNLEALLRLHAFEGWRTMTLGSLYGAQSALAGLLRVVPMDTPAQAGQLLARLAAFPRWMDQSIANLARGQALGWVSARPVLLRALDQIDGQLAPAVRDGPFFEPFRRLGPAVDEAQREALMTRGEAAIAAQVLPAIRRLRAFVVERYLPAAPEAGGLRGRPGGQALYAELVLQHTTTVLTPLQIHRMGQDQLARLHGEIAKVQRELKFSGSFAAFVAHLYQPGHYYPNSAALLDAYRSTAKRLDPEMPRLFAVLPRAPYGIRPMPEHLGPGAADNYTAPSDDGARAGWYNANVLAYTRRPRWALPTLVAHETVPGHHLQIARARELGQLPAFRRNGGYTAFSEGWALYAETLCDEIGLFDSPQDRFGHLQAQAFRAARLVVDTGLHAMDWSRQQAVELLIDRVGESPVFVESEVDRYLSQPAQALAYMVGQQHILGLRDRARQALGPRYDLRRFNNAVIDQGALPLDVLSAQIDDWLRAA